MLYSRVVYATREPKMVQFDWFAISGFGQYPMIEISNSGYCFHRKMSRFVCYLKQINPRKKVLSCLFLECSGVVYTKKIIHLLNE